MIAPLRNLDIRRIVWCRPQARCLGIVDRIILPRDEQATPLERRLDHLHDTAPRPRPDDGIRLRDLIEKLLPISLSKTACYDETAAAPRLLVVRHPEHRRDRLLFCRLNKGTRIDNQDICL